MSDAKDNQHGSGSGSAVSIGTNSMKVFADTLDIGHPEIFRYVTEQMQSAIMILDKEMNIVYCNSFCSEMLGYTVAELTGSSFLMPMSDKGRQEAMGYFERREGGIAESHPFTWQHRNGDPVHTIIYTSPIHDPQGNFSGAIGVIHDITKEAEMQNRVAINEARFRAVSEFSRALIWEIDPSGLFTYIGDNVEEILGYTQEEVCHKMHFYDLTPPGQQEEVKRLGLDAMSRRNSIRNYLNPILARDGREVWVRTSGLPVYDAEGHYTGYQGIDTDVTESRMLGLQLLEVSERLEAISAGALSARESERALLARELHDQLGQSLTAIRYSLDWLSAQTMITRELRDRILKLTSVVQESITKVQNYSFDLRSAELSEQGLEGVVREYCQRFFSGTGITGEITIAGLEEPVEESCALALYRILQEALTNVARHARATRVKVTLQKLPGEIHLAVADDGVGMPERAWNHPRSIGLKGMSERAGYLGGEVSFSVNGGTTVVAKIPVAEK